MWAHKHYTFSDIWAIIALFAAHMHYYRHFSLKNPLFKNAGIKSLENLLKIHFFSMLPALPRSLRELSRKRHGYAQPCKLSAGITRGIDQSRVNDDATCGSARACDGRAREYFAGILPAPRALCRQDTSIWAGTSTLPALPELPALFGALRRPPSEIALYRTFGPCPRPCWHGFDTATQLQEAGVTSMQHCCISTTV